MRLIKAGESDAERMPGSSDWRIPLTSVRTFERQMAEADRIASEFSRSLDELGSPLA